MKVRSINVIEKNSQNHQEGPAKAAAKARSEAEFSPSSSA